MEKARFELALDRLKSTDWARFEELAREFLAPEFPTFRSVAAASGDKGRDSELFSPDNDATVVLQFSVTKTWSPKIKATAKRISKKLKNVRVVIYATNQLIGAKADELKKDLSQDFGLFLDIRDQTWFIDRFRIDPHREKVAEELAKDIVDPFLQSAEIIESKSTALSGVEAQAALIYLELQWEDDTRAKGLTKVCFEALVRSALRETDSENRLGRDEILSKIYSFLPTHPSEKIDHYTNRALTRLAKKSIRHWVKKDEFCLSYEEKQRLGEKLTQLQHEDDQFIREIQKRFMEKADESVSITEEVKTGLTILIRRITERFLLSRGELFARSVQTGQFKILAPQDLRNIVIDEIQKATFEMPKWIDPEFIENVVLNLLDQPGSEIMPRLRRLADSYSLMAFLRETPDVQSAVLKMFSNGEIWLDTIILLPLLAEEMLDPEERSFGYMLAAAREAGIKLYVTPGMIEEVYTHINRCVAYLHQRGTWIGRVPFLYSAHSINSRQGSSFSSWIEHFVGGTRPEEDIAEYIDDEFGIKVMPLSDEVESADIELRSAVKEEWIKIHQKRRQGVQKEHDEHLTMRLAEHDTENYVGVIQRRSAPLGESPFGYSAWWLTVDKAAWRISGGIAEQLQTKPPASPLMSPDFLVNYLAFGPMRRQVSKNSEAALPLILEGWFIDELPTELLEQIEQIREENKDLPDRIVRRRIRDALDDARQREGDIARGGFKAVEQRFGH